MRYSVKASVGETTQQAHAEVYRAGETYMVNLTADWYPPNVPGFQMTLAQFQELRNAAENAYVRLTRIEEEEGIS